MRLAQKTRQSGVPSLALAEPCMMLSPALHLVIWQWQFVKRNQLGWRLQVKAYFIRTQRVGADDDGVLETFVIMEFCDQRTLHCKLELIWDLLRTRYPAGLRYVLSCLREVAMGLEYLHTLGLVHGDLKGNNILLQSTRSNVRGFTCKIADLGCSRLLSLEKAGLAEVTSGATGTTCYAAPELLRDGTLTQVISSLTKFAFASQHGTLCAFCRRASAALSGSQRCRPCYCLPWQGPESPSACCRQATSIPSDSWHGSWSAVVMTSSAWTC